MEHTEFVAALRAIADFYEDHPGCPLPYLGASPELPIYSVHSTEDLAAVAREFGRAEKGVDDTFFFVKRDFGAVALVAREYREKVCTRVVVGTETVEREVHDPNVPMVTVTETVEKVEWVCPDSILRASA